MSDPLDHPVNAEFMDGVTAKVHSALVLLNHSARPGDSALIIRSGDRILDRWALTGLREKAGMADPSKLVLTLDDLPDARLSISDPEVIGQIRAVAPDLSKRDPLKGVYGRIARWAAGAIAAVLLVVFVIVPALSDQLAQLIPTESERKLGEASVRQISWVLSKMGEKEVEFCVAPEGTAALEKMMARFDGKFETSYDVNLRVMKHEMENAFAVPGGQMVLFDGLIQKAKSPEEIAGVLGHELGHVVNRDPTRLALRSAGTVGILGMLVGDFSGGALVLILTERLISASYAQDAERNADGFAYRLLERSGLPTTPFGDFFDRMAKIVGDDEGLMSHLASHPNLSLRASQAREADTIGSRPFERVLSEQEWYALRNICSETAKRAD